MTRVKPRCKLKGELLDLLNILTSRHEMFRKIKNCETANKIKNGYGIVTDKSFEKRKIYRKKSNHWRCSVKNGIFRNLAKFTGE